MGRNFVNDMKLIRLEFIFSLLSIKGFAQQNTATITIHTFCRKMQTAL